MEKKKNKKLKFYAEAGHFAAVCENFGTGITVMPRYFSGDEAGRVFLTAGCMSLMELLGAIDRMIHDLQELRKNSPAIISEFDSDYLKERFGNRGRKSA